MPKQLGERGLGSWKGRRYTSVTLHPRHMLNSSTLQARELEAKQKATEKQNYGFC